MNLRSLRRPGCFGLLIVLGCLAWHFRPISRDGLITVKLRDGSFSCIDEAGRFVFNDSWDVIVPGGSDNFVVLKNKHFGVIDRSGNVLVPLEWERIHWFNAEGVAAARKNGKYGFIDRTGKVVLPFEWDHASGFNTIGVSAVGRGVQSGFIDQTGELILPPNWDSTVTGYFHDMLIVQKNGKWGIIHRTGEIVLALEWDELHELPDSLAVCKDKKWGVIDRTGKLLIPLKWDFIYPTRHHELLCVIKDKKYGIIDRSGKLIIPLEWDHASMHYDTFDLATVRKNQKEGCIDRTGTIIIPIKWDYIIITEDDLSKKTFAAGIRRDKLEGIYAELKAWLDWLQSKPRDDMIYQCHVYDPQGNLIWRNDAIPYHLPIAAIGLFLIVMDAVYLLHRWRQRRSRLQ